MKATITNVTLKDGMYLATYSTGTVKKYRPDALPGTVRAWMDANVGEDASNMAEPVAFTETETKAEPVAKVVADKEEAKVVVMPARAEVVPVAKAVAVMAEPEKVAEPVALPDGQWPLAWLMFRLLDVLTDIWFWATTWIPIGARWLLVHFFWDVLPVLGAMASGAGRMSVRVARAMVMASGAILRGCEAIGAGIVKGWVFRSELIQEAKVA